MRGNKKRFRWMIAIVFGMILLCGGYAAAYYFCIVEYQQEYEEELQRKEAVINQHKKFAFIAVKDIQRGGVLTDETVEFLEVLTGEGQEVFMDAADLYKSATVEIKQGEYIKKSMVTDYKEEEEGCREMQLRGFALPSNIRLQDYVDIRIVYPNGETYVVLAKKRVVLFADDMAGGYFWMTPEEIDRIQSAIVDAYLFGGTSLFLTKYIAPSFQEASIVNYTPSRQTIALIRTDPNIVRAASAYLDSRIRMELEGRMPQAGTVVKQGEGMPEAGMQEEDMPAWPEEEAPRESAIEDSRYFME